MRLFKRSRSPTKSEQTELIELVEEETNMSNPSHPAPLPEETREPITTTLQGSAAPINEPSLEDHLPLVQAVKRYPKVVGYCLGLTLAVIGSGYDLVIVSSITAVDSFLEDYGQELDDDFIIPAYWLSLWLSLPPVASAIGAVVGGWLSDRGGRRLTLMLGCVVSAVGVAGIFFSYMAGTQEDRRSIFTAGITVQGLSVGIVKMVCATYVSENAPTALRGPAMGLFPTFTLLGQLLGSVVVFLVNDIEGKNGYLATFASQWILSLAPFILACIIPESPAYLIRKAMSGERERDDANEIRALRSCERLFAPKVNAEVALASIRATAEEEKRTARGADMGYLACFRGVNLRRTLIVCLGSVVGSLFGLDLLSNTSYFLRTVGMPSSTSLMLMIFGVIAGIAANGAGIWVLSRVGRRRMILVSFSVIGALWGAMGVSGFWQGRLRDPDEENDDKDEDSVEPVVWMAAGIMLSVLVVAGLGCWPASFAVMGETSSLQLRAPTQGIGGVTTQIATTTMAVVLPFIFNPDAAALGLKTGLVYLGLCAIGVGVSWLSLPEMKGRTIIELDHMFEMRLPTRKFKHWKMEEEEEMVEGSEEDSVVCADGRGDRDEQ